MTSDPAQDNTNHESPQKNLAAKKAAVLGSSPAVSGAGPSKTVLALCTLILVAVFSVILLFTHSGSKDKPLEMISARPVNGELVHATALLADGQARHFAVQTADGVTVRYFVLQTPDGVVRTAFDACDACWEANMGYVQDGDVMICRNCKMRFPSRIIGEVRGGCNPTPLPSEVRGGQVVIRESDLLDGRRYFDFGSRSARG